MRQGDGLRDDGGGAGDRRSGAGRDGHRQYHRRGSAVRRTVWRGAELWTGPGTGVVGAALEAKRDVVAAAVARHREAARDPFDMLRRLGGFELAAITGAVMAARLGRVPVVLDGFASTAAAAVLYAADPHALDHCVVGHVSAEPGHRRLVEQIGQRPLLDLGMRLGEGSGATLAFALLKAAVACHTGMATFAEAGVSGPN